MKKLKLLNKKCFLILLFFLFFGFNVYSEEPVDIWKIGEEKSEELDTATNPEQKKIPQNTIYEMQSQKNNQVNIEEDKTLTSKEIEIIGLYDPEENGLNINMWSNSNGDQILNIIKRINKIDLSEDASQLLDILLLTNAYYPEINISREQFFTIKSNWLKKNSNFELIENYILNNQVINEDPRLTRYLVDNYLSKSNVKKACEIFSYIK